MKSAHNFYSTSPSLTHCSCQPLQITTGIKTRACCPDLLISLLFGYLPPTSSILSKRPSLSLTILHYSASISLLSCLPLIQCLPEVAAYSLCSEDSFRLSGTHLSIALSSSFTVLFISLTVFISLFLSWPPIHLTLFFFWASFGPLKYFRYYAEDTEALDSSESFSGSHTQTEIYKAL